MDPRPLDPGARRADPSARWVGVGRSTAGDPRESGRESARQALSAAPATGGPARLLLTFVSRPRPDAAAVLAGIRDVAAGVPLAGCSSVAGISPSGPDQGGVVLIALGGDGLEATTDVARDVADWRRTAGSTLASGVPLPRTLPHQVLLLLTDGLVTGQLEILRGVYGVLGASVPVFGTASSAPPAQAPFQLHGRGTGPDEVLSGAVVAVTLSSAGPVAIGLGQGWRPQGRPMTVTAVRDDRVLELDDAPALDAYLDRLDAPPEAYRDLTAFRTLTTRHPVGVRRRVGMALHDLSVDPDFAGRTLGGRAGLPEGSVIRVMTAQPADLESVAADAVQQATDTLAPYRPVGLLVMECAAQRDLIGPDGVRRGAAELLRRTAGVPFGGCVGFGEIARARGLGGFHNRTAVALALA